MWKKPSLVGKTKYDGPKNVSQIVKQIKKDLNNEVTEEYIRKVIFYGFLGRNIRPLMNKYESFKILGCCRLVIRPQEKRRRALHAIEMKERTRVAERKKFIRYRRKWVAMKGLAKLNVIRQEKNLKLLTLREYLKISKYYKGRDMQKILNLTRRKVTKK